jgi:hypothetical protein
MHIWIQQAADAAAAASPSIEDRPVPDVVPGRVVHVDGDMLAYWAGGSEDISTARRVALQKLEFFKTYSGAEDIVVHLTHEASTKGDRRIVATVKPYQGQRSGTKPKSWGYLREFLTTGTHAFRSKTWSTREADDGFGLVTTHNITKGLPMAVIATKDKDMRMLPGIHMDWDTGHLVTIEPGCYEYIDDRTGLLYGHKWFWQQMLQGDTADNIPGLPRLDGKTVGPKRAKKLLAGTTCNEDAFDMVSDCYAVEYGAEYMDRFVEQAVLLWMRTDAAASVRDFLQVVWTNTTPPVQRAVAAVEQRIKEAYAEAQKLGGCGVPQETA